MIQQSESNHQFEVNMNPKKSTSQRSTFSNIPMNRGTTHIFYKTRMCQKFLQGICRNGDGCTFAHGPNDLREPPPNWQELLKDNNNNNSSSRGGNWTDEQKIIHRMRLCRKFSNGDECPYGEKCNFLHESPAKFKVEAGMDYARTSESSVINIQTAVDYGQTNGHYIHADKCHIAHGLAEIHNPVGHASDSVAAHMVDGPTTEPLATGSATAVPVVRQGIGKGFLKLANRKLNVIYGDWIDDVEDDLS